MKAVVLQYEVFFSYTKTPLVLEKMKTDILHSVQFLLPSFREERAHKNRCLKCCQIKTFCCNICTLSEDAAVKRANSLHQCE